MIPIVIATLSLSVAVSCRPSANDSSDLRAFTNAQWLYGQEVEFVPEMADSTADMSLIFLVRHGNAFPYSNLWIEAKIPTPGKIVTDTFNVKLAEADGTWLGKGLGLSFQLQDTICRNIRLIKGKPVKIRHIMQIDTLNFIEQIGIGFEQIEK